MTVAPLGLFLVCGMHLLICCTWSSSSVVANGYSSQLLALGGPPAQRFPLGLQPACSYGSVIWVAPESLSPKVQYIPQHMLVHTAGKKKYFNKIKFKIPGRIDRKVVEIKKSQGPASYQASAHNQTLPLVVPMLLWTDNFQVEQGNRQRNTSLWISDKGCIKNGNQQWWI